MLDIEALEARVKDNKWLSCTEQYKCLAEIARLRCELAEAREEINDLSRTLCEVNDECVKWEKAWAECPCDFHRDLTNGS